MKVIKDIGSENGLIYNLSKVFKYYVIFEVNPTNHKLNPLQLQTIRINRVKRSKAE